MEGDMVDISPYGACMTNATFLPKGTLVDVQIPRVALLTSNRTTLEGLIPLQGFMNLTGEICYARPDGFLCMMGISFLQIDETDRFLIKEFAATDGYSGFTHPSPQPHQLISTPQPV